MPFLDNWVIVQRNPKWEAICADYNLPDYKLRIESPSGIDLENEQEMFDLLIFDSKGMNIHNKQYTIVSDVSIFDFIEKYRDEFYYRSVDKNIVQEVINILTGKTNKVISNIPIVRQEKPCCRCKRMCDVGDAVCWWCTIENPTR